MSGHHTTKKPPVFVPPAARRLLEKMSKAMLMDIAWNLALLGTDETCEQVLAHVAREADRVALDRGDRISSELAAAAIVAIDADGPNSDDGYVVLSRKEVRR